MNFKGITCGTYYDKRAKKFPGTNKKYNKSICAECKLNKSGKENIDNEEQYNICKSCDKFYVSKSCKALLTIGRDQTTGKVKRKTFIGETEEEAFSKALQSKLKLDEEGGPRIVTKTNKTLKELVEPMIEEQFKLGQIKESTYKRKLDTLKQLAKTSFANRPIAKISREDVVNYLANLKSYSKTTIKQNYELLCMGFGEAYHQGIIQDNFMAGYKRIKKPKSEYVGHHRIALTIEEQKKLIQFLIDVDYSKFKHKYLFLLLMSTGMRIGEALVLDYTKDIDLEKGIIIVRRTQTKDTAGKSRIGDSTKTFSGQRIINLNTISKSALEEAVKHIIPNKFHLLFYNPTNKNFGLYEESSINSALKRAGIKLNLGTYEEVNSKGNKVTRTDLHTHMLRGTFATRCAEAKIDPNVLKEILGHSDTAVTMKYYIDIDTDFISLKTAKSSLTYIVGEYLWYHSSRNDLDFISKFSKFWTNISDDGVTSNSAYGYILQEKYGFDQIETIINLLEEDPTSRRAVLNINVPNINVATTKDELCTIALIYFIRDNKLHSTTIMRSNDVLFGLRNDLPYFIRLQKYIADSLGVEYGSYTHFATSIHLYEKDMQIAKDVAYGNMETINDKIDFNVLNNNSKYLIDYIDNKWVNKEKFEEVLRRLFVINDR